MGSRQTVKARARAGAASLDLTIPARLVREHEVGAGDMFAVEASIKGGRLVLTYIRVY